MAKASDDRSKATQSKLGRGLGSLIPVPIQRPAALAPTGTSPSPEPPVETSAVPASAPVAPAAPVARTREIAAVEPKPSVASRAAEEPKDQVVVFIPVRAVQPGKYQPRGSMDPAALETLARSIEQSGLMQPVVVRALGATEEELRRVVRVSGGWVHEVEDWERLAEAFEQVGADLDAGRSGAAAGW